LADSVPPCPHFGTCGGCSLQDQSDAEVAAFKREGVVRALRAAGLDDVPVAETRTVPPNDRRRVKLAFTRTKKTTVLGFHAKGTHTVVPVPDCQIARPEILAAMPVLADLLRPGAPRKRALAVTVTVSEGGLDVAVEDGKELDLPLREGLGRAAAEAGLAQRFGRAGVVPPPGAFLQASATGESILRAFVLAGVAEARTVADLFSGCGAFSLPLAEKAAVTAVESEAAMIDALDAGWRGTEGLHQVDAVTRDLFRRPLLPDELNRFDAVVFDPPRAGARSQVEHIATSDVPVVIGVSCMPSTFARDAAVLVQGGYRLEQVMPVDQFRWSSHVEMAGIFRRS